MKVALACALQAKNATVSRRGHSARQLVFGRQCYMPELLDEETWGAAAIGQALSLEGEVARQAELRAAAKMALLRSDIHEKLKVALRRAPGGQVREFAPGEMVYFWSPASDVKNKRYKRNSGAWRGPAVVLMPDGQQKYFVSWRGRCLLVAAANLKVASLEAADDHDLRLREAEAHLERGYLDLSDEVAVDSHQEAESNVEPHLPALRVRRPRNGLGRKLSEAQRVMKHLKSVKRMLKLPLRPQLRRRPRRVQGGLPLPDGPPPPAGEVRPEDVPVPSDVGSDYAPSESPEVERVPQERLVPVVPAPVDAAALRRRQEMLDDLPNTRLFRKRLRDEAGEEAEPEQPQAKRLRDPDFNNYVLTALSEGELFKLPVRKKEWLSKAEVNQLGKLLDLPLSSVRLRRAPRKRLQRPGPHRARPRTTVMFQKDPSSVLVGQETAEQVEQRPQRKVPFLWRGMTLFTKQRRRGHRRRVPLLTFYGYSAEGKQNMESLFVQKDGVTYAVPPVNEATFYAACADMAESMCVTEAFLLKMKASGKELDARFFDEKEAEQFAKSDLAEWEAWEKNKVVQRLSPEEARRVPAHRVFRVPARVVRTNKAALGSDLLQAKSRIVLPGHTDPDLGSVRTDSPTTQESAVRLTLCLAASRSWCVFLFDVSTAFLSGKAVGRELYVRPPRDLAGIHAGELWRILRSAYGLAEAPRLWYERAKECLSECGFEEVAFAPATFVLRVKATRGGWEVRAVLCLHVDDGLLAACRCYAEEIRKEVDKRFQIKVWHLVGDKPCDYLGLKLSYLDGNFITDMTEYVLAIQFPELAALKPKAVLTGEYLKAYRRLVAQLRWPAHRVLPELLFPVSSLAQRVSGAVWEDLVEAVSLLETFHSHAREGQARLKIPAVGNDPVLITYFDASLGKTSSTSGQRGEVHFISGREALSTACAAGVIEFHSNKIARVVRSSMAAECCSMSAAADRRLYNQKLLEALWHGYLEVSPEWKSELTIPGYLVTDAKSLFDHVHGSSLLASERQTSLDILSVRQLIQEGHLKLFWVPTWKQYGDMLTKSMQDVLFRSFRKKGCLCLVESDEDQAEEARRAGVRKGQRERRKARMSAS